MFNYVQHAVSLSFYWEIKCTACWYLPTSIVGLMCENIVTNEWIRCIQEWEYSRAFKDDISSITTMLSPPNIISPWNKTGCIEVWPNLSMVIRTIYNSSYWKWSFMLYKKVRFSGYRLPPPFLKQIKDVRPFKCLLSPTFVVCMTVIDTI